MGLKDHMKIAIEAAGYARMKVKNSSNYEFTSSPIYRQGGAPLYLASNKQMTAVRGKMSEGLTKGECYAKMSKRAKKHSSGNCHEVAIVACEYLVSKGVKGVELVIVMDDSSMNAVVPHVISVIGRPTNGKEENDIGLPGTWGAKAVVCDAWDRVVYPASMYNTFWDGLKDASDSPNTLSCFLDMTFG